MNTPKLTDDEVSNFMPTKFSWASKIHRNNTRNQDGF